MKTAFVFPGQGSQKVGMGKDIYENYEEARKIYDMASEILKIDVAKLCFDTSEEELNKTQNTQIAIVVMSLAILEVLKSRSGDSNRKLRPDIEAGLSLGEYVALIDSGFITFEDGIKLIQKRGFFMQNYVEQGQYAMAAIIGLESSKIKEACEQEEGFVVPSNYNYTNQTVISGEKESVNKVCEKLKQNGARKIVMLKTSGPFHTEKLSKAKELYEKELQKIEFKNGDIKVLKNLDGTEYVANDDFVGTLSKHIVSPVRFDKEIEKMQKEEIDLFVEIGPGKTLTGFIKKQIPGAEVVNINNLESLNNFIERNES